MVGQFDNSLSVGDPVPLKRLAFIFIRLKIGSANLF